MRTRGRPKPEVAAKVRATGRRSGTVQAPLPPVHHSGRNPELPQKARPTTRLGARQRDRRAAREGAPASRRSSCHGRDRYLQPDPLRARKKDRRDAVSHVGVGSPSCSRSKGQAHGVDDRRPSAPALEVESIHRLRPPVESATQSGIWALPRADSQRQGCRLVRSNPRISRVTERRCASRLDGLGV